MRRRSSVAALLVLPLLLAAAPPRAAAPRIIMVWDASTGPFHVTDWHQNQRFLFASQERAQPSAADVTHRPYLEVALFWDGSRWEPFVREGRLAQLDPEAAEQRGRFYPARGGAAALLTLFDDARQLWSMYRIVGADALGILASAGVPVAVTK